MNTGRQNTCDKIRDTLRYIDINFHLSKTFHVEVIDSLELKPRTHENRRKWKKWKKRDMSIRSQFSCITLTLIFLKILLLLAMGVD